MVSDKEKIKFLLEKMGEKVNESEETLVTTDRVFTFDTQTNELIQIEDIQSGEIYNGG